MIIPDVQLLIGSLYSITVLVATMLLFVLQWCVCLCGWVCVCMCIYVPDVRPYLSTGASYARAEAEVNNLVVSNNLPFLPTPMGKGLLADDHPLCVAASRSK